MASARSGINATRILPRINRQVIKFRPSTIPQMNGPPMIIINALKSLSSVRKRVGNHPATFVGRRKILILRFSALTKLV